MRSSSRTYYSHLFMVGVVADNLDHLSSVNRFFSSSSSLPPHTFWCWLSGNMKVYMAMFLNFKTTCQCNIFNTEIEHCNVMIIEGALHISLILGVLWLLRKFDHIHNIEEILWLHYKFLNIFHCSIDINNIIRKTTLKFRNISSRNVIMNNIASFHYSHSISTTIDTF